MLQNQKCPSLPVVQRRVKQADLGRGRHEKLKADTEWGECLLVPGTMQ